MILCVGRTAEEEGGEGTQDGRMGGRGGLISVRNNKRHILGPEWSIYKVGTPPPHYSDKHHGLVDSINNTNNNKQSHMPV